MRIEIDDEKMDAIHELLLRGLVQTDPADREYAEAYDSFLEASGRDGRIGNFAQGFQEFYIEIMEGEERPHRPNRK